MFPYLRVVWGQENQQCKSISLVGKPVVPADAISANSLWVAADKMYCTEVEIALVRLG